MSFFELFMMGILSSNPTGFDGMYILIYIYFYIVFFCGLPAGLLDSCWLIFVGRFVETTLNDRIK